MGLTVNKSPESRARLLLTIIRRSQSGLRGETMIRYAYAAAAAVLACAPAEAVVIYAGQVGAGQGFGHGEALQPGETRQYVLEVSGGPLEQTSLVVNRHWVEYRRTAPDTLWSTSLRIPTGCFEPRGDCVREVPVEFMPFTYAITITALADIGLLSDCDLPSAIGAGICHLDSISTTWGFSARALGPTTFTLSLVPEPSTWAMLISGFGMIGSAYRLRRRQARFAQLPKNQTRPAPRRRAVGLCSAFAP